MFVRKNAKYYREQALNALRGNWGIAVLAAAIAALLGGVASFFSFSESDTGIGIKDLFSVDLADKILNLPSLLFGVFAITTVVSFFTSFAFRFFVGAPVRVGYEKFNLALIDGKKPSVKMLFDAFHQNYLTTVVAGILLELLQWICLIPVTAVLLLAFVFRFSPAQLLLSLPLAAVVAVLLSVVISLRFRFTQIILAEYPDISATDALRNSAALMRGNVWKLFCLEISFIGWAILALFTFGIGYLWLMPYLYTAETAFYDEIANRAAAKEAVFPSLNPDDYADHPKGQF